MALPHLPSPGSIVMAEFPMDFLHGEMEKKRPVIVLNKKGRLATVIPISMTVPDPVEAHHVEIPVSAMPKGLRDKPGRRFAKCDCINTLSLQRLELVKGPKVNGKSTTETGRVPPALLLEIRRAVAHHLRISAMTFETPAAALAALPAANVELVAEAPVAPSVTKMVGESTG